MIKTAGYAACMAIESSKVTTCMENEGETNSKATCGGKACRERDFLRKAISWSRVDACKEQDFSRKEGSSWSRSGGRFWS
jgi:hypothetical protein